MIDGDSNQHATAKDRDVTALELRTLSPKYNEAHHGTYVNALRHVIDTQPAVQNLALTGAYGTGKSSILEAISKAYPDRVIQLSLSTVGGDPEADSVSFTDAKLSGNPAASTKTNRIQKEIVKQLLYKDEPNRTRGSRFRRITRFRWRPELGLAGITGVLVAILLYLTDLGGPLVATAGDDLFWKVTSYVALAAVATATVFLFRSLTHNQIFLEKLSAGPATVSLSAKSTSYFDEYLDEIVYRFEVSGRDIVVFEDIDRFEDVHIFETLRALNTLLNGAQQIRARPLSKSRRKSSSASSDEGHPAMSGAPPLRFIYAIRDSVFAKLGEDEENDDATEQERDEIERANRTKFFDLVIPVVPFITHRNARDLMDTAMEGTGVGKPLVALAAQHVADMRLIWNIRNEFDVYSRQLLGSTESMPGLNEDRLFAMLLYKNVHLADFEAIRFGNSKLDDLHDAWRVLVEANMAEQTRNGRAAIKQLYDLNSVARRSKRLGQKLTNLATVLNSSSSTGNPPHIILDGVALPPASVGSAETWTKLAAGKLGLTVQVYYGYNSFAFQIPFEKLGDFVGETLDPEVWRNSDEAKLESERDDAAANVAFLRHHDWQAIYLRTDFSTAWAKSASRTSSREEAEPRAHNFEQLATAILPSRLARDLVANGYINDYFALYISMYYGNHLRHDALNYIVHAIDQGVPDSLYPLAGEDVEAILTDKTDSILTDPSMYNVSILDHLLLRRPEAASALLKQMSGWGNVQQEFATQYITYGLHKHAFVRELTRLLPGMYEYLASADTLDEDTRAQAFDDAMSEFNPDRETQLSSSVRRYVEENYTAFGSLTDPDRRPDSEAAMNLVSAVGAELASVVHLSEQSRSHAAISGVYALTEENLLTLAKVDDVSLDTLLDANSRIYKKAVSHLHRYVDVLRSSASTSESVSSSENFERILKDLEKASPDDVAVIVEKAAAECTASHLFKVPTNAWTALVAGRRVPATFPNVDIYIGRVEGIDAPLGSLLAESGAITDVADADEDSKVKLATAILSARDKLADPRLRANLVASLDLAAYLPVSVIVPEEGALIGHLLEANVIEDSSDAFSAALMVDWPTREFAIEQSQAFPGFMTPAVLPSRQVRSFIESPRIAAPAKARMIQFLGDYVSGASRSDLCGHRGICETREHSHGCEPDCAAGQERNSSLSCNSTPCAEWVHNFNGGSSDNATGHGPPLRRDRGSNRQEADDA